jgi:hypothetical protein
VLAGLLLAPGLGWARAHMADAAEYQVKAAFLIHFMRLTEWPPTLFEAPVSRFVVCVLGDSPIVPALDGMVTPVQGRPMSIRRLAKNIDPATCQVLFISGRSTPDLDAVVRTLPPGVLTISEVDTEAQLATVINFVVEANNTVEFDVSMEAANRAHLDISARLLSVARGVDGRKRRKD